MRAKLPKNCEGKSEAGEQVSSGGDMLRRVGEGRKKVMGLYRLLGNKADVIKGFAKRCNEHWDIAPRSEIGLYLGDIQDHILTMTSNLNHYETYVHSYNVINMTADSCVGCCLGLIQLSRSDQHPYERATGANCRCFRKIDRPRYNRLANEHHHWHVGNERLSTWTRRRQFVMVLV